MVACGLATAPGVGSLVNQTRGLRSVLSSLNWSCWKH